jgi:hypothetical protein
MPFTPSLIAGNPWAFQDRRVVRGVADWKEIRMDTYAVLPVDAASTTTIAVVHVLLDLYGFNVYCVLDAAAVSAALRA